MYLKTLWLPPPRKVHLEEVTGEVVEVTLGARLDVGKWGSASFSQSGGLGLCWVTS